MAELAYSRLRVAGSNEDILLNPEPVIKIFAQQSEFPKLYAMSLPT